MRSPSSQLDVEILGMNALWWLGERHPQMHSAQLLVVNVDERVDGLLQGRHLDVGHLTVVLEKLEQGNLAMFSEGSLDLALGRSLSNVGNVKSRGGLEDVGRVLRTRLLEAMQRRAGVIFGELGALQSVVLGALNVFVLGGAHVHRLAEERNFVQVLTRDLRHPRLRHLNKGGILLGKENLDAKDVSVNAKKREEDIGRHARLLQVGDDEDAAALTLVGHAHQAHAGSHSAHHVHGHPAELVVASALRIISPRVSGLSSADGWFAENAHACPSGAARCDKSVVRKTCLPLTGGRVTRLHHLVGTRWQSGIGEIPTPFVVVFDVEFGQFGELDLQLATSVVDVLSVENLSRVFCGVTRTVFHQSLKDVVLSEGDDLLNASMLLEDVGDGVHADRVSHILDVDVENIATGQTIVHKLDQVTSVRLRLGFQLLVRGVLDIDGPAVQLEGRRQTIVVVDHVHGRLLVLQFEESLAALRLQDENVGDQTKARAEFDDLLLGDVLVEIPEMDDPGGFASLLLGLALGLDSDVVGAALAADRRISVAVGIHGF